MGGGTGSGSGGPGIGCGCGGLIGSDTSNNLDVLATGIFKFMNSIDTISSLLLGCGSET